MRKHFMFKVLFTLVIGLFLSVGAFAQQITVNGIVKDTTGEPVIGANVLVKGTTNGTITDFDGNFQLSANKGDIIVISFIGFTAQELPATAELMNVVLKDDSEMLSEVVVIGYGVARAAAPFPGVVAYHGIRALDKVVVTVKIDLRMAFARKSCNSVCCRTYSLVTLAI